MNKAKKLFMILPLLMGVSACNDNTPSTPDVPSTPVTPSIEVEYTSTTYSNPIAVANRLGSTQEFNEEIGDPSVVRGDDGYFYVFATDGKVLRSEDGVNFYLFKRRLIETPAWGKNETGKNCNIWAPDVVKIGDNWIYYYSLGYWGGTAGVGYAISDSIDGEFVDCGKLFSPGSIGIENCIDPQVIVDGDSVYMAVGSFRGIYLLEMESDGLSLKGGVETQNETKTLIAGYPGPWDGATYEGTYIVKKDDYFYFFGSVGSCCEGINSTYHVRSGRSKDIKGPYLDSKGMDLKNSGKSTTYGDTVVWAGTAANRDTVGPGHNSILVDDAGDFWMYYHSFSKKDEFSKRRLFIDKLVWDENGFPHVDTQGKKPSYDVELDGPRFIVE